MRATIEQYLRHRRAVDTITTSTLVDLRSRLHHFADTIRVRPGSVTRRHVTRWLESIEHLSPATRRAYFSTVRVFFRWCVDEDIIAKDPTRGLNSPKVPTGVPKRLTAPEIAALIAEVRTDLRLCLIVLLMLQEGLRRGEIATLRIEDIDPAERTMLVRGKGGHGVHTAVLPITDETWSAMLRYRADLGHHRGPLIRSLADPHRGISANRVSDLVSGAMIRAGVKLPGDHSRTPHSCRHTAAHDILARTRDIRAVQQALRHQSVTSTEIYLRGHASDLVPVMAGRSYLDVVA